MTEEPQLPETDNPQVSNLSQVSVEQVNAEMVRLSQSSATEIHTQDAALTQSAALQVDAENFSARESAVLMMQAKNAQMEQSTVAALRAESVSLNGGAVVTLANQVEFGNAYAGFVAGREVRGEKIETLILLSRHVEGNVSTVMDTRGALIAGLVGGLFAGMMLLLGRMLFGKR